MCVCVLIFYVLRALFLASDSTSLGSLTADLPGHAGASLSLSLCVCVCLCVCESESERERPGGGLYLLRTEK